MPESGGNGEELRDELVKDYGSAIRESALLTTFSGFLFGFLLNISIFSARQFTFSYKIIILIALFNIMVAICLFIMPVIYHHIEFPYRDVRKFIRRSHRFMVFGFFPTAISLYLGMVLAFSQIISDYAYLVAAMPFLLVFVLFQLRKLG